MPAIDDDAIGRKLYNLAKSNKADHIPRWGALGSAVCAFLTYAYCFSFLKQGWFTP